MTHPAYQKDETLRNLILEPGISGYEDPVRNLIMNMVEGAGRLWEDSMGNLVLELGGSGSRVLMAAHMDELGLLVTGIMKDGTLAFRKLGGIEDQWLPGLHVTVHTKKGPVPGIIGALPPHIRKLVGSQQGVPAWHELRIDVGVDSEDEARDLGVETLDPVTFMKHYTLLAGGRRLSARGIDDRAGCAALVELAQAVRSGEVKLGAELMLAWTVQEEVGLRGAHALASRIEPELFVAVDTTTCCHPSITGGLRLGRGPVVRAVDNHYIAPPRLVRGIARLARARRIPVQVSTAGGGTDAAAFQLRGVPSVGLSAAIKYTHSMAELLDLGDYEGWIQLLRAIAEEPPL